jgi:hypothetical protein
MPCYSSASSRNGASVVMQKKSLQERCNENAKKDDVCSNRLLGEEGEEKITGIPL